MQAPAVPTGHVQDRLDRARRGHLGGGFDEGDSGPRVRGVKLGLLPPAIVADRDLQLAGRRLSGAPRIAVPTQRDSWGGGCSGALGLLAAARSGSPRGRAASPSMLDLSR